jgi:anti-repressor protein
MDTAITIFKKDEIGEMRTSPENGGPWFNLNDVCAPLELKNPRKLATKLKEFGGVTTIYTPTSSGVQPMTYINEANLYRVIFQSRKPEARRFEAWVVEEILPSLRKTGTYTMPQAPQSPVVLPDYPTLLRQHADLIEKAETLEKQRLLDAPKVELVDNLDATTYRFDDVAKFLPSGMGAPTLRTYLLTKGWIFKTERKDCPYKAYQHLIDKNLFILHLTPVTNENAPYKVYLRLDFTIKGVKALIDEFHKDGVITSQQRMNDIMMQIVSTCKALVKKAS